VQESGNSLDFAGVGKAFARVVPHRLYTVTWILPDGLQVERIHSSDPVAYPLGGRKPVGTDAWSVQVIEQRQCFLANEPAGFEPYFADHAFIVSLGLGAVINVPVVEGDRVLGTLNFLDRAGTYEPWMLDRCLELAASAVPAFRAHEAVCRQAESPARVAPRQVE
jgi:hypothetical protein